MQVIYLNGQNVLQKLNQIKNKKIGIADGMSYGIVLSLIVLSVLLLLSS
jgi:tetrahydromethanopterin S-methyltransferase subunit G